jgi:AraC-like DNA-binding protein
VSSLVLDPIDEPIPFFAFSAEHHTGRDRFDAWQHEVAQLFDAAPVGDTPSFEGAIDGYLLDGMLVARTQFSEQTYRRDRRLVARTGLDAYLVQLYTGGGFDGYADAAEISVRAGDVCVFDMSDTLATRAMRSSTVSLVIPKLLVDRHWNARAPVNGLVIPGRGALGQVMGAHLAALSKAMPDVKAGEAPIIAATTARLVADCLAHCTSGGDLSHGALQQALFERAVFHIRGNLGSPDLSPDTICRALKVSRPHLYRAFKNKGGVMRSILDQRLRFAFNELANPLNRDETIGSIAFRCGFASDSHFTRLFRQTFGARPTDVREAPPIAPSANSGAGLPAWLSSPAFVGG